MVDASPAPAPPSLTERLGPRAERRAWPRLGPALGGAGAALAFFGVIALSFDNLDAGDPGDDPNNLLGALLCALTVAAGYAVIARLRIGAAATAGSAVATAALPFVFFFLTFDEGDSPPFSVDVTILLTTGLWLAAYLTGPARGRPILLGAAAAGVWLFVLEQVEGVFTAPFSIFPPAQEPFGGFEAPAMVAPDPSTIGFLSLLFGAAYVTGGFLSDRRRLQGLATPLLVVGYAALVVGFGGVAEELEATGTGILITATGAAVSFVASRAGRRASTWLGAAAVALGLLLVVGDIFEDSDSATGPALTLIVLGGAVAAAAEWWARQINEPSELALQGGPSTTTAPGGGPAPGPPATSPSPASPSASEPPGGERSPWQPPPEAPPGPPPS